MFGQKVFEKLSYSYFARFLNFFESESEKKKKKESIKFNIP